MGHVLVREQVVSSSRSEVFAFGAGTTIDYRLSLLGVPFRWRTVIDFFEPESRFIDVQASGPYRSWRHLHEFEDVPWGTLIRDRVDYELPFGPIGALAHKLFVRRQLDQIFGYRRRVIDDQFGGGRGFKLSPQA